MFLSRLGIRIFVKRVQIVSTNQSHSAAASKKALTQRFSELAAVDWSLGLSVCLIESESSSFDFSVRILQQKKYVTTIQQQQPRKREKMNFFQLKDDCFLIYLVIAEPNRTEPN